MKSEFKFLIRPFKKEYQEQVLALILNIQRNEFNITITADEQLNKEGFINKITAFWDNDTIYAQLGHTEKHE